MFEICQKLFSVDTNITDFKLAWSEWKSLVRALLTNHLDFQVSSLLQKWSRHCIFKHNMLDFTKFSFSPIADHQCADRKVNDECWCSYVLCCFQMGEISSLTHGICWLSCLQCSQSFLLLLTEKHAKFVSVILSIAASYNLKTFSKYKWQCQWEWTLTAV